MHARNPRLPGRSAHVHPHPLHSNKESRWPRKVRLSKEGLLPIIGGDTYLFAHAPVRHHHTDDGRYVL